MHSSLYLFPIPVLHPPPDKDQVAGVLRALGFAGERFMADRYQVGEGFFRHISFAGCSPHLPLEPSFPQDLDFCHLSLHWNLQPPPLLTAVNRGRPRCPVCRGNVPDWKDRLASWRADASQSLECVHCGARQRVAELDWRQYGLAAASLVQIHHVYPGEALPGDSLMAALAEASGREWAHAWAERL